MKIDNSKIFTADIYEVTNSSVSEKFRQSLNHGDSFGSYSYEGKKVNDATIVVYFGEKYGFVPIWHLKNILEYASTKLKIDPKNEKFLKKDPGFMPANGKKFIKNVKHLFGYPGKTSLTELLGIQRFKNDANSDGMEILL